ncbi:GTP-binding protein [Oxalobacteraceae bacterium CAVE-383]|nr:GTP-binding protein [Oxalobacteraceae bacterium CAVE-383]
MTMPEAGTSKVSKAIRKIPITLLTGFLGSGKTTLLRRMLTLPGWNETVVLVNELGEVGLDHHLLGTASDAVMLMENGCICCSVRDDLIGVLEELFWKRLHRQMPYFKRVVVETTGLADPGPIVRALLSHSLIAERYALDSVLCTVDALAGAAQLASQPESLAQVAAADMLLVTKTDCMVGSSGGKDGAVQELETALHALNPLALLRRSVPGELSPQLLDEIDARDRLRVPADLETGEAGEQNVAPSALFRYRHHDRVQTTTLRFARQWQWDAFEAAMRATLERHGDRILRIKGWLDVAGESGPVVVQAVGGTMFAPEKLAAWPEGRRNAFLVCITAGVPPDAVGAAFHSHLA